MKQELSPTELDALQWAIDTAVSQARRLRLEENALGYMRREQDAWMKSQQAGLLEQRAEALQRVYDAGRPGGGGGDAE